MRIRPRRHGHPDTTTGDRRFSGRYTPAEKYLQSPSDLYSLSMREWSFLTHHGRPLSESGYIEDFAFTVPRLEVPSRRSPIPFRR